MVDNNARTKAARAARKQAAAKRRAEAEATGRALEPAGRINNNVPYTENFADADKVLKAAGAAMTIKEICALIGISEPTLRRCYRAELDSGHAIAISKVANVAFQIATDVNHPKVAQMAQFWLRSRGKWQLNDNVTVTGADGQPLLEGNAANVVDVSALSVEELDKLRAAVEHIVRVRSGQSLEDYSDDDERD